MKLPDLEAAVRAHTGEFDCVRIHDESETRVVAFAHETTPPGDTGDLPDVGRLRDVYATFGSIVFYQDAETGDAARHVAAPGAWAELRECFDGWFDGMDEDELEEYAPAWTASCLVIGETPRSGNYILLLTEGDEAGHVYEFDHDGMEFDDAARDLVEYVEKMLQPDARRLTDFASHMRFIERGSDAQWWIRQMRDSQGRVVATDA
jgi:hypothetical protein